MNKTILSLFAAAACAANSEASRPYSFSNEKALPSYKKKK